MKFQLIYREAQGDRFELRNTAHSDPIVEGQLITDGAVVAIYGSLWKATQVETRGISGFLVTPADTAPGRTGWRTPI